ncbi:MAG: hypothetical protein RMX68_032400 [Aulosira sp. ZfuVER01]|nr:hypothetical protein [Aulosira sp. ZfuVER01]MDZ8000408.1 hypothetical protein [Aulosira sp. DedVER01a]MDZ8052880.1 hypothetical protein [Aulosira sp. ZfuCHP01]
MAINSAIAYSTCQRILAACVDIALFSKLRSPFNSAMRFAIAFLTQLHSELTKPVYFLM